MSALRTVGRVLGGSPVADVLVAGWIDRDDAVPEFRPQPVVIWLRLPDGFLRLEAVEHVGAFVARRVAEVSWSDIPLLAGAVGGEESIGEILVVGLRAYVRDAYHSLVCLALDFTYRRTVFLDPTWTFGIRIGNEASERRWLENERDAAEISRTVIHFGA